MTQSAEQSHATTATACPVCAGPVSEYCRKQAYQREWIINRCRACGHAFVANRPDLAFLGHVYATDPSHLPMGNVDITLAEKESGSVEMADTICRLARGQGYSLDVGSGNAAFSYHLAKRGFKPVMIDLDPRAAPFAAQLPGGEFSLSGFEEFQTDRRFHAIIMSQVLEHAMDPRAWLRHAFTLLHPDGVLAIALPNFSSVYRFLGARDPFINPPIHLNHFTPGSLRSLAEASGLEVLRMDSLSEICVVHPVRQFSLKRRVIGRSWNLLARPILDLTRRGLILRMFARRRP